MTDDPRPEQVRRSPRDKEPKVHLYVRDRDVNTARSVCGRIIPSLWRTLSRPQVTCRQCWRNSQ